MTEPRDPLPLYTASRAVMASVLVVCLPSIGWAAYKLDPGTIAALAAVIAPVVGAYTARRYGERVKEMGR